MHRPETVQVGQRSSLSGAASTAHDSPRRPPSPAACFSCGMPGMARAARDGAVNHDAKAIGRSDWEVQVLWGLRWQELLAEKQLHCREVTWGGSCKLSHGPRNRNRIGDVCQVGEGATRPKARCHPDLARVARRVKGKQVLLLIRRYLQVGVLEGGLMSLRLYRANLSPHNIVII